jgi:NAD(P)-dependent dehydrogenase (short-subunit alcohol dehydrogenase family)
MTDLTEKTGSGGDPDYRSLFDLTGKHALVIGAGGIGAEVAAAIAAHGALVTVADVDVNTAARTADRIGGQHVEHGQRGHRRADADRDGEHHQRGQQPVAAEAVQRQFAVVAEHGESWKKGPA